MDFGIKRFKSGQLMLEQAYIISYYTPVYDYDKYLPFAQKMVDSFRILKVIK